MDFTFRPKCDIVILEKPQGKACGFFLLGEGDAMGLEYDPDSWPAAWVLQLIAKGDIHAFYNSPEWKQLRRRILTTRPCRCQICEGKSPAVVTPLRRPWDKDNGRPVAVVHHINELRRRPDLALSEYDPQGHLNLAIACPSCHWNEHHKRARPVTPERW